MYAIYLRKSRADMEAEARGEGETLARHRKQLLDLAEVRRLSIGKIYEEIVSGDTIADRPQMSELLRDVEACRWEGVLVMDVDRLGRGDSIDQGTILKTFKYSGTKIITVYKTYDPNNEMDEEFFEFSQQIARSEYRRIKRRMWAGRVAAAKEGKYQSPKPPFGYERKKLIRQKGWSLEIIPDQADAVRMIFDLYLHGENGEPVGMNRIANRINMMGFKTYNGLDFTYGEIGTILSNPVYIGKIRWNQRQSKKSMVGGKEVTKRMRSDEYFEAEGLHAPIVDKEIFDAVQAKLAKNQPRKHSDSKLLNPFAGLMVCPICGKSISHTPIYNRPAEGALRCTTPGCATSSIVVDCVEDAVITTLQSWLDFAHNAPAPAEKTAEEDSFEDMQRKKLEQHIATLQKQINNLHDLLEQGIYDTNTYVLRNRVLSERLKTAQDELNSLQEPKKISDEEAIIALAPRVAHVLETWPSCKTAGEKNELIKTVVRRIIYHKTHRCFRNENPADFLTLILEPILDF